MELCDVEYLHPYVAANMERWQFFRDAYAGTRALVANQNVLPKHPREEDAGYARRVANVYGFGYSAAVVDLLTFYLFQQPAIVEWGDLAKDPLFEKFLADADLFSTDLDVFLTGAQKAAAVQGHSGILVDKPVAQRVVKDDSESAGDDASGGDTGSNPNPNAAAGNGPVTQQDEEDSGVYPYVSVYEATNILDWKYKRDSFGRPYLAYLKLLDDVEDPCKRRYRVWTPDRWEVWVVNEVRVDPRTRTRVDVGGKLEQIAELENTGTNPLGKIPFTWVLNAQSDLRNIGVSDLKEISYIDASIIRNLSQAEEVTEYAAFPMMMKPILPPGEEEDDTTGVTVVVEFDPNYPGALPQWMDSKVQEPVDAIFLMIAKKVEEIYRSVNAGGLNATETSTQVKSGVALQQEFRLLNAKLASKSAYLEEAEKQVIGFWALWQGKPEEDDSRSVSRPRNFNISDLMSDLESVLVSTSIVNSELYDKKVQKLVVRRTLTEEKDFSEIDDEIDAYVAPEPLPLPVLETDNAPAGNNDA